MMKLGSILRACRERAGLSQEELAFRMKREQACISRYENDRKVPDALTFLEWFKQTNTQEVAVAFMCGVDGITIMQQLLPIIGAMVALWFV